MDFGLDIGRDLLLDQGDAANTTYTAREDDGHEDGPPMKGTNKPGKKGKTVASKPTKLPKKPKISNPAGGY